MKQIKLDDRSIIFSRQIKIDGEAIVLALALDEFDIPIVHEFELIDDEWVNTVTYDNMNPVIHG